MRLPLRGWRGQPGHLNFVAGYFLTAQGREVTPRWGTWVSPLCVCAIFDCGWYFAWRWPPSRMDRQWALALRTRGQ